jgi:hypothetical protein
MRLPTMENPSMPTTDEPPAPTRGSRGAVIVIGTLLLASVPLGLLAWFRFKSSEVVLTEERAITRQNAPHMSSQQCVERVLALRAQCAALPRLCDQAVGDNMDTCLAGRDRSQECAELGDQIHSTRFGFDACRSRSGGRALRTACATAYRAIAASCQSPRRQP